MDYELIGIRAIHFGATMMVGGIVLFQSLVAPPGYRRAGGEGAPGAETLHRRLNRLLGVTLTIAVISGAAWLMVLSARIANQPLTDVFSADFAWIVLTETRFGHAWTARLIIAGLIGLGAIFLGAWDAPAGQLWRWTSVVLAVAFLGAVASSGHAGATAGLQGEVHWISDFLHLVAAGAWLGALLPLVLLLAMARRAGDRASADVAAAATHRFSILGMASVATIAATGIVNSWNLVGSARELVDTDYGRLLFVKIAVFIAMTGVAAVNLLRLTPRLPDPDTVGRLHRNGLIEIGLGIAIVVIVSVLGTTAPGMHAPHMH